MTDSKRSITVEDLYKFQIISEARVSPDGRRVVFVVQRVHQKTEKKYTNLWLASSDGKSCRQFTQGDQNDSLPRWSPDGHTIAFVSNREDEKQSQIFLIPVDGGEAAKLTELEGSTRALEWSPDGESLLLNFRSKDAEAVEREKDSQKKELGVVSRHITRLFYKADGSGYVPEERWHIWTVDAASGEATQLTEEEFDENTPTWSPDGKTILFASNRHEDPDAHLDAVELYTIPAGGGELTQIETGHDKSKSNPVYSPDGEWIAYLGRRLSGSFYQNTCLYLAPAAGGQARNLTKDHDLHISSSTINDVGGSPPASSPQWSPDGKQIYIQVTRQGNQLILAVSPFPEVEIAPVLDGKGVHGAFSLNESGQQLTYFHATLTDPGQMWHLDLGNGEKT
jgi:Tol biopolymer transport system component